MNQMRNSTAARQRLSNDVAQQLTKNDEQLKKLRTNLDGQRARLADDDRAVDEMVAGVAVCVMQPHELCSASKRSIGSDQGQSA